MRARVLVVLLALTVISPAGQARALEPPTGCVVRAASGVADEETCTYLASGPGMVEQIWLLGSLEIKVDRRVCYYDWGCWWEPTYWASGCGVGPVGVVFGFLPIDRLQSQRGDRVTVTASLACAGGPVEPGFVMASVHDAP
jgi:hypothetical protein